MELYERNGVWCFDHNGKRHKFVTRREAEHAMREVFHPEPDPIPVPEVEELVVEEVEAAPPPMSIEEAMRAAEAPVREYETMEEAIAAEDVE